MISYAKVAAGVNVVPPNRLENTLIKKEEEECPEDALSCTKNYSGCCVPRLGAITLSQQWIVNKPTRKFTLHGFWSGDCATGQGPPDGCDPTRNYGGLNELIRSNPVLHQRLQLDMPSGIYNDLSHWKHQWRKHGTCLTTVRTKCYNDLPGQDAIRYFNMAINLYDEHNISEKFRLNHIVPSNQPYTYQRIMSALYPWNNHLSLHCVNNKLKEIRIYLLGKARNQFVPRPLRYRGNCSDTIYLPFQFDPTAHYQRPIVQRRPVPYRGFKRFPDEL